MRSAKYFLLLLTLGAVMIGCDSNDSLVFPVLPNPTPADFQTYAGSNVCRNCHQAIFESWGSTRHHKAIRAASLQTAVNDADSDGANDFFEGGAGATFDVGTSVPAGQTTFDDWMLGSGIEYPKLGWNGANLIVRVGPVTYAVSYVLGGTGEWDQRFLTTIGNQEYILPVQYNEATREYVPYHAEHWYTISGNTLTGYLYNSPAQTPVTLGNTAHSWQNSCMGCHVTGIRDITKNANGEYGDNIADMLAGTQGAGPWFSELEVACEACHGPTAHHVELGGGIGTALNPAVMASDRASEVCGSCHSRGTSANAENLGYPWAEGSLVDGGFRPGDVLDEYFNLVSKDDPTHFWQDGTHHAKSNYEQFQEHMDTPHANAGVTCFGCHNPHGSGLDANLKMEPTQLCLSCHDGQGNIDSSNLMLHTRHQDPEAQSCENCHFTKTAKSAVEYDIPSHTYRVIFPVESEMTPGLPNTCANCHKNETTAQLTGMLSARWPDVHPVAYASSRPNPFGVGFNLLGTMSIDPLGGPLTYKWALKSGPPTYSQNDLIGATADSALFVPSAAGEYTFMLTVTNSNGLRSWVAETTVDVPASIVQTPPDLTQSFYVGSDVCSACHSGTHSSWEVTRHQQILRRPNEGPGVVFADTDENGTNDWMEGGFDVEDDPFSSNTTFDDFNWGAAPPFIDFSGGTYTVDIGPNTYDVTWVVGGTGKWGQRYLTTIDNQEYILPIQYNQLTKQWVPFDLENWYTFIDGNGNGRIDPGETVTGYVYGSGDTPVDLGNTEESWQHTCVGCHVTGAVDLTKNGDGEYGASLETMLAATTGPRIAETGVGCESCHGPASQHVQLPTLRGAIINPAKLSSLRSNEICAACHSTGVSENAEQFGFPWGMNLNGGNFQPGIDALGDYFTFSPEDGPDFWDDPFGHSKTGGQWLDMRWSKHFQKAGMTCGTCHTGHNNTLPGQLKTEQVALCTSCHQGFKDTNPDNRHVNHSRHFPGMTKCSDCHQPKVGTLAADYDLSAHSWRIIFPQATEEVGIPNSCNTCHDEAPEDIQDAINELWGDLVPVAEPRVVDPGDMTLKRDVTGLTAPTTITLDGSRSYDPNGSPIAAYSWTIVSAPAGNNAKLNNRTSARTTIDVVVPGTYVFSLTASDLEGTSQPAKLTVVVQ